MATLGVFLVILFYLQIRFFPTLLNKLEFASIQALQNSLTVAVRAEQGFGSSLGWQQTYVQGQKSEFRIKLIWFAVNGIITIHCNVTIITAAETYVHQIHHEWFHYGTRRYQWGTCSSFPYRSKTQRSAFVLGWRRAQIEIATHCTMPIRRRDRVHPLFTLGLNSARAVREQAASGGSTSAAQLNGTLCCQHERVNKEPPLCLHTNTHDTTGPVETDNWGMNKWKRNLKT